MSADLRHLLDRVRIEASGLRAEVDGKEIRVDALPDMRPALTNAIYQRLHCGSTAERLPVHVRNPEMAQHLRRRIGDRIRPVVAPRIRASQEDGDRMGDDGSVLVLLDGLRVRAPRERVVSDDDDDQVTVAVSRLRPMLSPGFFVVLGDTPPDPITRVYIRGEDAAEHAGLFTALIELLDERVAYRAKILTMPGQYPRNDAIVLYLHEPDESLLSEVVALAERSNVSDIVSPFTRRIGRGVAAASEPRLDASGIPRSFGENRSEALARALVDTRSATRPAHEAVASALREMGLDPARLDLEAPNPRALQRTFESEEVT